MNPTEAKDQPTVANQDPEATHTNFVLLGHPRCGSNLLVRALALHPQVRMAGEVLGNDAETRANGWNRVNPGAWTYPRGNPYQAGENATEFLQTRIFGTEPVDNVRAFGFKLFYDHARSDETLRAAWDYILQSNDIRIIHLERRNLLYALISQSVALRTKNWHRAVEDRTTPPPPLPPFVLEPAVCQKFFDETTARVRWAEQAFAAHPVLRLEYEADLCAGFAQATDRIWSFLGLMPWRSRPLFLKQQTLTARQQLANFAELQQHFRDTPYAAFFEDADSESWVQSART